MSGHARRRGFSPVPGVDGNKGLVQAGLINGRSWRIEVRPIASAPGRSRVARICEARFVLRRREQNDP
jgi:hypothetical protein